MSHYFGRGITLSDEQYSQYLDLLAKDPQSAQAYAKQVGTKSSGGTNFDGDPFAKLKEWGSDVWNGLTGKTSANATLEANKMNIENQNYWNEIAMQREDTAHQREVADLQAAGLNPWLSAGGGAPASAMSTAQAEPVDGSKILQATSALALMAVVKLLGRTTSRTSTIIRK